MACTALSAAWAGTIKGLVSIVCVCIEKNVILTMMMTFISAGYNQWRNLELISDYLGGDST